MAAVEFAKDPRERQEILAEDIIDTLNRFSMSDAEDALRLIDSSMESPTTSSCMTNSYDILEVTPTHTILDENCLESSSSCAVQPPSSTSSYSDEWDKMFNVGPDKMSCLTKNAVEGCLRSSHFRSVAWRVFIGVLSSDSDEWVEEVKSWRKKYTNLKQEHIVDPRNESCHDSVIDDPLSLNESSVWNRYFRANEVRREIMQDVVRTFPELEFFHDEEVRASMTNILFCFSQSSSLGYKQGMHEVLAPLMFVLRCDQVTFKHATELGSVRETLHSSAKMLFDSEFLEADSFAMFSQIMDIIGCWYVVRETSFAGNPQNPAFYLQEPFSRSMEHPRFSGCSAVQRLSHIQEILLKQHDLSLALHLEKLEIVPQMYGLRWLRLLFGREYPLDDLLVLWDAIFAIRNNFILVDYIFVSMLKKISDQLLSLDFAGCLCLMMRYPTGTDVSFIIRMALHLYKPRDFQEPTENLSFSKNKQVRKNRRGQGNKSFETMTNRLPKLGGLGFSRRPTSISTSAKPVTKEMYCAPTFQDSLLSTPDDLLSTSGEAQSSDFVEIRMPHERQADVDTIRRYQEMCSHCATVLESCVLRMENYLLANATENEDLRRRKTEGVAAISRDDLVMPLAGVKQVLYILNGSLEFVKGDSGVMSASVSTPGTEQYESLNASAATSSAPRELELAQASWNKVSHPPK